MVYKNIILFICIAIIAALLIYGIFFNKNNKKVENFEDIILSNQNLMPPFFYGRFYEYNLDTYNVVDENGNIPSICGSRECRINDYLNLLAQKQPPRPGETDPVYSNDRVTNGSYQELSAFQRQEFNKYSIFLNEIQLEWSIRSQTDKIKVFYEIMNDHKNSDPTGNSMNLEEAFPFIFPTDNSEPNLILYQYQLALYSDPKFKSMMNDIVSNGIIRMNRIFLNCSISDSLQDSNGNCENPDYVTVITENKQFRSFETGICEKGPRSRQNFFPPLRGTSYSTFGVDKDEIEEIGYSIDDGIKSTLIEWSPTGTWSPEFTLLLSLYNIYNIPVDNNSIDSLDFLTAGILIELAPQICTENQIPAEDCTEWFMNEYLGFGDGGCTTLDPCDDEPIFNSSLKDSSSFFENKPDWNYWSCYTKGILMPIVFPNNWYPLINGDLQGEHRLRLPTAFSNCGWSQNLLNNPSTTNFTNMFGEQDKFEIMYRNSININTLIESILDATTPYTDTRFYDPTLNKYVVSQLTGLRKQDFNRRFNDAKRDLFYNYKYEQGNSNFDYGTFPYIRNEYLESNRGNSDGWVYYAIKTRESFFENEQVIFIPSAWYFYTKYQLSSNSLTPTTVFTPIVINGLLDANAVLFNKSIEQNMLPLENPSSMSKFGGKRGCRQKCNNCTCLTQSPFLPVSGCRAHAAIDFFDSNRLIPSTEHNMRFQRNFKNVYPITDGIIIYRESNFFTDQCSSAFDESMYPNGYQKCSVIIECKEPNARKRCQRGYKLNKEKTKCCKTTYNNICSSQSCTKSALKSCPRGFSCVETTEETTDEETGKVVSKTTGRCCKKLKCSGRQTCINVDNQEGDSFVGLCGSKNKPIRKYGPDNMCEAGSVCKRGNCKKSNGDTVKYPALTMLHIDGLTARYGEMTYNNVPTSTFFMGQPIGTINHSTLQVHFELYMGTNDILPWVEGGHPYIQDGRPKRNPTRLFHRNWNLRRIKKINNLKLSNLTDVTFNRLNKHLTQRIYPYTRVDPPPYKHMLNLTLNDDGTPVNPTDYQTNTDIQEVINHAQRTSTLPNDLYHPNIFAMRYLPSYYNNCHPNCPDIKCPYQRRFDLIDIEGIKNIFKKNFDQINIPQTTSWNYGSIVVVDWDGMP